MSSNARPKERKKKKKGKINGMHGSNEVEVLLRDTCYIMSSNARQKEKRSIHRNASLKEGHIYKTHIL